MILCCPLFLYSVVVCRDQPLNAHIILAGIKLCAVFAFCVLFFWFFFLCSCCYVLDLVSLFLLLACYFVHLLQALLSTGFFHSASGTLLQIWKYLEQDLLPFKALFGSVWEVCCFHCLSPPPSRVPFWSQHYFLMFSSLVLFIVWLMIPCFIVWLSVNMA